MSFGIKNMGSASEILHMISLIITIIFMLSSLQCTYILVAGASMDYVTENANTHVNRHELHFLEGRSNVDVNRITRVSGRDDNEDQGSSLVERFKAFLGLKSISKGTSRNGNTECLSPAPSPSAISEAEEASAPVPVPAPPTRRHFHSPPHDPLAVTPHRLNQTGKGEDGSGKKTLVVVLVSTGGAAFVVCAVGVFLVCVKLSKQRKKSAMKVFTYSKKGGRRGRSKYATSRSAAGKVSLNSGPDLFYLDSLRVDLEQQPHSCLKQTVSQTSEESNVKLTLHESEECHEEIMKSESDNVSSSSTREIMSVHDETEPIKFDHEAANSLTVDKIIPADADSSDDESFHSFNDSQCSHNRLSNASVGSLSESLEKFSADEPRIHSRQMSPRNSPARIASLDKNSIVATEIPYSRNLKEEKLPVEYTSDSSKAFTPPPPPPPPPLYSCSRRIAFRSSASRLSDLSAPGCSNTFSTQNACQAPVVSSTIPPPPCPPPFSKRNNSFNKAPPPPPAPPAQIAMVGKNGVPLPKLKPLHWDKVRATPDRCMVWDKLRSSSFEFDEEMIESLFGYDLQSPLKNDEARSKTPSPSKHILEPKRLQNITILAKALNATADKVCYSLTQGNSLSLQQLEALVKMVPTREEETKLTKYEGDINELASAEQFVKTLLTVPFSFLRIEAMLYRETFEDEVVHLKNSFSMLEEACKELKSSRLFLKLLEAVLKTGNRMNVGTIRGGAKAFKLDALLKLADVKGTDGKTTLLHFVVQEIIRSEGIRVSESIMGKISQRNDRQTVEEKEEDYKRMGLDLVSGLSTELYNVKKTATIDLDVLASSVSNLSDGMTKLQHLLKDLNKDEKSANFVNSMRNFINYAEKNLKELQEDEDNVLLHVRQIREYFHGDVSKDDPNPLRIFVIVRDFLGMLDHVCKELRSFKAITTPNPLAPFR